MGHGYNCKKVGSVSLAWEHLRAKARSEPGKRRRDGRGRNIQNPVGWGVIHSNTEDQIRFRLQARECFLSPSL